MAHMLYQALICLLQVLISVGIYVWYGIRFPVGSIISGNFLIDFALTLWIITYAADLVALMVSCIVRTTTSAMTGRSCSSCRSCLPASSSRLTEAPQSSSRS